MAVTAFIPELWNARLLYALDKAHVATNLVNRNYQGQIAQAGDTVHINSIGAVAVKAYTANSDIAAPDELSTTDQTLVINQCKYFNFQIDDVDAAQAAGEIMDIAMARAAYALADTADAYLLGVIAAGVDSGNVVGTKASPIALTASNIYENIVKVRMKLDKANVPTAGRTIVVPPEAYALLLQDDRFAKSDAVAGQEALLNGMVGRIAGFDVFESNNAVIASDGGASSNTDYFKITAQVPAATTYAEQIIKTEAYRLEKRFADGVKGLHVYGAKVTDGKQIAALLCTIA
ncbi:MAG: P22 coat protein - protein 5 domain protein [Clostridium sp.]|nr:P22 coat protein - protein 5 domain protein [Clostridium sp.]